MTAFPMAYDYHHGQPKASSTSTDHLCPVSWRQSSALLCPISAEHKGEAEWQCSRPSAITTRTGFQAVCVLTPSLMSSKLSFGVTVFCPALASTPKCWLCFCHHVGLSHPLQTPGNPPLWLQPFFFTSVRSQLPGSGSMACGQLWGRWSRRQGGLGAVERPCDEAVSCFTVPMTCLQTKAF